MLLLAFALTSCGAKLDSTNSWENTRSFHTDNSKIVILLNSFDLDNQDSDKNLKIIDELQKLGKNTEAQIAKIYFSNSDTLNQSIQNLDLIFFKKASHYGGENYQFMIDKVLEKFLSIKMNYTHNDLLKSLDKQTLTFPNDYERIIYERTKAQDNFPYAKLNEFSQRNFRIQALENQFKMIDFRKIYDIQQKYHINQISGHQIIVEQHNLSPFSLEIPTFTGHYTATSDDNNTYSVPFKNLSHLTDGGNAKTEFSYGTDSYAQNNIYIKSEKHRIAPDEVQPTPYLRLPLKDDPIKESIGSIPKRENFDFAHEEDFKLTNEFLNIEIGMNLFAQGGYFCKTFTSLVKTGCKNHNASASASINGTITIPSCEDIYSCLPVIDINAKVDGNMSISIEKNQTTRLILFKPQEIKINFTNTAHHSGASNPITQNHFAWITAIHPLISTTHHYDFLDQISIAMSLINDDLVYANIVADMLQKAQKRTKEYPTFKKEEISMLYTVLSFTGNPNYQHTDESKMLFEIIQKSVQNRLFELNYISLKNKVEYQIEQYKEQLKNHHETASMLLALLDNKEKTREELERLKNIIADIIGRDIDNNIDKNSSDDKKSFEESLKKAVNNFIQERKNKLFIKKVNLHEQIKELNLYGENINIEDALH